VVDGRLRYSAPKGAYTDELRNLVAECRAELIAALSTPPTAGDGPGDPDPPPPWPPRPPQLTFWPDAWRQHWEERANKLESHGMRWQDAERQSFLEAKAARSRGENP
jgi:hypothetical protein